MTTFRGNLNYLLSRLSRNARASDLSERIQPAFQLFEQGFLSEKSPWIRERPTRRTMSKTIAVDEEDVSREARIEAEGLLPTPYGKAVLDGSDRNSFYRVEQLEGDYREGPYSIPQFKAESTILITRFS